MFNIPWMEVFELLFHWNILLYAIIGVIVGLTVGSLPGLTGGIGIALLLPMSFLLGPLEAVALLIGVYKASLFGGSISAITFGTPGTPSAAIDVLDGYPMTKQGKSNKALQTALYSSVTADLGSDLVLFFGVGALASVSLAFGSRELLALMILALTMVVVFSESSLLKGGIAVFIGLFLAMIGQDMFTGLARFDFGFAFLRDGIDFLPFLIGILAFSEIILQAVNAIREKETDLIEKSKVAKQKIKGGENLTFKEYLQCTKSMTIGWFVGTIVGMLPGPGATLATYTSYAIAKETSKNPEEYGKGSMEGLSAAEAGNSATSGATFIPLFALGIPGSTMAALFMGAFMMHGITPGPSIFRDNTVLIYAIFTLLILANFVNLIVGRIMTPLYTYLAYLPGRILVPFLAVFSILGVYVYRNNIYDVLIMVALGIIGYWLRAYKIPVTATVIAFILIPLIESNLRRSLLLGGGDFTYLIQSPLANIFFIATIGIVVFFAYKIKKSKKLAELESDLEKHQN